MSMRSLVAAVVAAAMLMAAAAGLQAMREEHYPAMPVAAADEALYVSSGRLLHHLAAGYDVLAADLYWIRAIQYYGGTKLRLSAPGTPAEGVDYRLLYPLLDLTTTVDPFFNLAYRFGSIFLAEPYPGGAGRPDLAIALLEKGLRAKPDKWEYMQDIGFVHYWWRNDYASAADWFDRASKVDGAPWWLRSLAATTLAEGGDRRSSKIMWQSILDSAENDWLKSDAQRRLSQLNALDFIDQLQAAVGRFTEAQGRPPASWQDLVRARMIPGIPNDPTGVPYEIDAAGKVQLSRASRLYPLPTEPKSLPR
jgi:tetratricopeptide (TPR) repeat protein